MDKDQPGLIVDRYGPCLVIQTLCQATERLADEIVARLVEILSPGGVLERNDFDPAAFEKEKGRVGAALRQEKRNQFFQAYLNEARDRFRVERRPEVFRRVVS